MANLIINDEIFGVLLPLINNDDITDINFNGTEVWVDDLNRGRYKENIVLDEIFQNQFATKLSNLMNQSFNKHTPLLEAETDNLRVSIIHESVTNTGMSISIRKTPALKRLNREKMIKSNYCSRELDTFMSNAIKAGCNTVIAGLPGVGKTEYLKALTTYIPANQKVITIEDNLEIRYHQINPGKDCVELKVGETFSYIQAIKACLRQLPKWILLSEARSKEVKYLLESMSTGTHCLTTIHTDDVRKIPDRIRNMMEKSGTKEENDIYSFLDIGVQIVSEITPEGIHRKISQVALLSRIDGKNKLHILYENGKFVTNELPADIMKKFELAGIKDPFVNIDNVNNTDNTEDLDIDKLIEKAREIPVEKNTLNEPENVSTQKKNETPDTNLTSDNVFEGKTENSGISNNNNPVQNDVSVDNNQIQETDNTHITEKVSSEEEEDKRHSIKNRVMNIIKTDNNTSNSINESDEPEDINNNIADNINNTNVGKMSIQKDTSYNIDLEEDVIDLTKPLKKDNQNNTNSDVLVRKEQSLEAPATNKDSFFGASLGGGGQITI